MPSACEIYYVARKVQFLSDAVRLRCKIRGSRSNVQGPRCNVHTLAGWQAGRLHTRKAYEGTRHWLAGWQAGTLHAAKAYECTRVYIGGQAVLLTFPCKAVEYWCRRPARAYLLPPLSAGGASLAQPCPSPSTPSAHPAIGGTLRSPSAAGMQGHRPLGAAAQPPRNPGRAHWSGVRGDLLRCKVRGAGLNALLS